MFDLTFVLNLMLQRTTTITTNYVMQINHVYSQFSFPRAFNFASSNLQVFQFPYETITAPIKQTKTHYAKAKSYLRTLSSSLMYMNLLLSRVTNFSFQIKPVSVMNNHPKATKSPYLVIKV